MKSEELAQRMKANNPPCIVDVRTGFEYNSSHIPGALHAPAWKILLRMARLPKAKESELVVTCEMGPRARIAQKLLEKQGYRNVTLLDGHMSEWRRSGLPLEK